MYSLLTLSAQLVSLKRVDAFVSLLLHHRIKKENAVIVYLAAMSPHPRCFLLSVKRENIPDDFIHSQECALFIQAPLNSTIHGSYY